MKAFLFAATVALGLVSIGEAHAQNSNYCIASSGTSARNTCGHMVEVVIRFSYGRYGANFLSGGESMNLNESTGGVAQILFACRSRQSGGGGVLYSGGRPVGCN